ncbi:MAG: hypothetical protein LBD73_05000 [Deferribacteraceae bacterium]|jgi:hypothetical protein|nr:hypothetical protein [Deferribacteraceae bacterium]
MMIWFKEYLKLKRALFALLIFHAAIAAYFWIGIRSSFIAGSPVAIWRNVFETNTFFFSVFEKPLYVTGLALAIFQFYPESDKRRFRISCHLPANEYLTTARMITFTIAALTLFWLLDTLCALLAAAYYFPYEVFSQVPLVTFYWYINALLFYAVASVLTLEPSWKHKIRLFIMFAAFYKLIGISIYNSSGIYIVYLLISAALFLSAIFYPAERFRKGAE